MFYPLIVAEETVLVFWMSINSGNYLPFLVVPYHGMLCVIMALHVHLGLLFEVFLTNMGVTTDLGDATWTVYALFCALVPRRHCMEFELN